MSRRQKPADATTLLSNWAQRVAPADLWAAPTHTVSKRCSASLPPLAQHHTGTRRTAKAGFSTTTSPTTAHQPSGALLVVRTSQAPRSLCAGRTAQGEGALRRSRPWSVAEACAFHCSRTDGFVPSPFHKVGSLLIEEADHSATGQSARLLSPHQHKHNKINEWNNGQLEEHLHCLCSAFWVLSDTDTNDSIAHQRRNPRFPQTSPRAGFKTEGRSGWGWRAGCRTPRSWRPPWTTGTVPTMASPGPWPRFSPPACCPGRRPRSVRPSEEMRR